MTEGHEANVDVNPYKEDPNDCYKEEHEKDQLDKYIIKMGDITGKSNLMENKDFYRAKYDMITTDSISTTTEEVSCPFPLEGKGHDKEGLRISEEGEYEGASHHLALDDQESTKVDNGGSSDRSGSSSGRSSEGISDGGGTGNGARSGDVSSLGKTDWAMGSTASSVPKIDAPKFCDYKDLYPVGHTKLTRASEPSLISKNELSTGKEDQCDSFLSSFKTPASGNITHQTDGRLHDYASVLSGKENENNNQSMRKNTPVSELPNESTTSLRPHVYPSYVSNQVNHVMSRNNFPHMFNGLSMTTTVGGQRNFGAEGDYTRMLLRGNAPHIHCAHKSGNKNSLNVFHLKNGGWCAHGMCQEGRARSPSMGSTANLIRGEADLERFVGSVSSGSGINGVRNEEMTRNGEAVTKEISLKNETSVRNEINQRSANSCRCSKGGCTHRLALNGIGNNLRNVSRTENLKSLSCQNGGMYHLSVRMNKLRSSTAVLSDPREAPPMLSVQTMPLLRGTHPMHPGHPKHEAAHQLHPAHLQHEAARLQHEASHLQHETAHPIHEAAHPIHTASPSPPNNAAHLPEGNLTHNPKVEDKKKLTSVNGGDVKVPAMTHPHVMNSVENANVRLNSSRYLSRSCFGGCHAVVDAIREGPHRVGRSRSFMGMSFDRDMGPHFQGMLLPPSGCRVPGSAVPIRGDTRRASFSGGICGDVCGGASGGICGNVNVPFSGPFSGIMGRDCPVHTCKGGGSLKKRSGCSCAGGCVCAGCSGSGVCCGCGMAILKNPSSRQRGLTGPYKKVNEEHCKVVRTMVPRRHFIGCKHMNNWIGASESKHRGKNDKRRPSYTASSLRSAIDKPNEEVNKEKEVQPLDVVMKQVSKTVSGKKKKVLSTRFEIKAFLLNTMKAIGIVQAKWKLKNFGMYFWFHIKCIEKERDLNFYVKFFDSLFEIMTGKGIHFQQNDLHFLVNVFKDFHIYDCKNILRTSLKILNKYAKRKCKDFSILEDAEEDILDVNRALLLGGAAGSTGGGADSSETAAATSAATSRTTEATGGGTGTGTSIPAPPSSSNFFDVLFTSLKENHDALQKVGQEKLYLSNILSNFNELNYAELSHLFLRK
ncbi:hypothetical protein C922_02833 [Plasmodium inui San Antonio 1]|uniref:Uncharacterized protein n=1 Tax=Plasmodium inui San Antonio 1 TaxID=1237626 RepID=W7A6J6_9APIC|nr:hypothetical protein C922_02833 [Plasmodium inui San Antonio 1]EUD66848.1 hypothetical protein C922_02833 [Plasmodium inui San Antonio 1]